MLNSLLRTVLAFTLCTLLDTSLAHAQATRTWVSGVGDDANPCSRTAPCKTFAGAISKTAAAGEISVLDPGGYGGVTITKSIIINGEGTLAGVLVNGAGITINGATVVATLRNLSLVGIASATFGVRLLNGAALIGDRLTISGFDTAAIETSTGSNATVINSTITQNSGFGVHALGGTSITGENSLLANNGVAVQAEVGATIRLSNNGVYNNLTGFGCGGTLASAGNNRKANTVGGGVPVCAPNAAITLQ
jgi:Right handed beta helix region